MARTLRQFTCRDDLWARVEALAQRRGMTTDDVVQAALVQLFSRKNEAQPASTMQASATPGATPAARANNRAPAPVPRSPTPGLPRPNAGSPSGRLPPPTGRTPAPAPSATPTGVRPLYLYFEGQVYEVNQDQFVIGRGSKYSDLPIKDANISRRHCAIVRRNGQYFIKDLESTNGVEFNGQRVDNHLIQEGTTYRLCDHELRFSFIPPS
jgi:pSer/pThr/pTyr-binding forkhead associated (FHA) protein